MSLERRPLFQITEEALRILYRELGVADTVRFLSQFREGTSDYTAERCELIENESLDRIIGEIQQKRVNTCQCRLSP